MTVELMIEETYYISIRGEIDEVLVAAGKLVEDKKRSGHQVMDGTLKADGGGQKLNLAFRAEVPEYAQG